MRLSRTYAQQFFLVSTAVVVVSGLLTVALVLLMAPRLLDRTRINLTAMDAAIQEVAPSIGAAWEDFGVWRSHFRAVRGRHLAPVRINVITVDGRVLYREGDLLRRLDPKGTGRLDPSEVIGLLAGRQHIEDDWVYAVAPVRRDGAAVGFITADLKPYSRYRGPQTSGMSPLTLLLTPTLVTVIMSMLASIYLASGLRRRLTGLSEAIQSMAEGDYRSRLSIGTADEVGQVAAAFNHMADKLEASRIQEQNLERLKRDLIANVSHDLRGPLTSLQGYVEALEDGLASDPVTIQRYAGVIRRKSEYLSSLVEDLLLYARLESGNLPLQAEEVEVADWLRQSLADAEPEIAAAGLTLAADIPERCGVACIDSRRMRQVVSNLVQNSVRHAPRGSCLHVTLLRVKNEACVTFADKGPGLDAADLPHLFDRFYRGRSEAEGIGTGLGLAIAAQIVQTHGGRIWAENSPAGGAVFRFTVPLFRNS
ncbi:MAG: ATP-binding protein [Methanocella sp.]